jgi:hypothetical protein
MVKLIGQHVASYTVVMSCWASVLVWDKKQGNVVHRAV